MIGWQDLHRSATHERALRGNETDRRRSISTLYYGLFHRLCAEAAVLFRSGGPELEMKVRRAFDHRTMKDVCEAYVRAGRAHRFEGKLAWQLKPEPRREIGAVAAAFVELQQARHRADYDLGVEVLAVMHEQLLETAEFAHSRLDELGSDAGYIVFLSALLLHDRWSKGG